MIEEIILPVGLANDQLDDLNTKLKESLKQLPNPVSFSLWNSINEKTDKLKCISFIKDSLSSVLQYILVFPVWLQKEAGEQVGMQFVEFMAN